jgi:hypothetical protein
VRLIKMIGLAAVAALAAMAFLGASSASASELYIALCKEDILVCPEAKIVKHVHEVDSAALLLNSILNVTCTGLFLGDVEGTGLAHLTISIVGNFSYSGCKGSNGSACEAVELNGPATIAVMKIGAEKTEITGEGEVLVKCGSFLHCVYNGTNLKGTGEGPLLAGGNGVAKTHEATTNKVSGFLCPATSKLDSLYVPLTPTYISS